MGNDQDLSQQILALLPVDLMPGDKDLDSASIISRLQILDRQEFLLVIAYWLYEHRDVMDKVDFEMGQSDSRIYLDNDEVGVDPEVEDPDKLIDEVEELQEDLDGRVDDAIESFSENLLLELNAVKWKMPKAWSVLEKHADVGNGRTGQQWLALHRASWEAQSMEQDTNKASTTASPRQRM